MTKVNIRNLSQIQQKDKYSHEAFVDTQNHLSSHLSQIQALQKQIAALTKKVG